MVGQWPGRTSLEQPAVSVTHPAVSIRRFRSSDIPRAEELRRLAGWNQSPADWLGYLAFEPDGCFVAESEDQVVGTATTIRYESNRLGWIGMVLVHPERRRYGIGTALLRAAIDHLRAHSVRSIKLDATPMGKKVYVPLGFVDEYEVRRYEGVAGPGAAPAKVVASIEPLRTVPPDELVAFDRCSFGVARPQVLAALSDRNPGFCSVAREAGEIAGYLIAREGSEAIQLGPSAARTPAIADTLLLAFLGQVPRRRILVDVPAPNAPACARLAALGFHVQRGFTRMYLGENDRPGIAAHIYATSGAEKG